MAVVFSTTFDTDPGAFGSWVGGASVSASWNSGAEAFDISNGTALGLYDITGMPFLAKGEIEIDLQLTSATHPNNLMGIWLIANSSGSPGTLISYENTYWMSSVYGPNFSYLSQKNTIAAALSVGNRRTLVVKFNKELGLETNGELVIDSALSLPVALGDYATLKPAIWTYSATVRVHSIIVRDTTDFVGTSWRDSIVSLPSGFALPNPDVELNPIGRGLETEIGRNDVRMFDWIGGSSYRQGAWRIVGTTKLNQPPLVNVAARVFLLFNDTGELIRETRSDPVTGAYVFKNLDPTRRYMVLAQYDGSAYRAVIADNLGAELT